MPKKGFHILPKVTSWILAGILFLGVVFLAMDNCGSTAKYNKLKGEYETYHAISKKVVQQSIQTINEQGEEIGALDKKIESLREIIEVKDKDLADKEEELGELQKEFDSLDECQGEYNKLVDAFTLSKAIGAMKDKIIFNLNEKYEKQVTISLEYKKMYESMLPLVDAHIKQVKELEKINRRLKLTSKLKTGIAITMAGVVLYSLLKD